MSKIKAVEMPPEFKIFNGKRFRRATASFGADEAGRKWWLSVISNSKHFYMRSVKRTSDCRYDIYIRSISKKHKQRKSQKQN
jgi:hypothetical protein